MAKTENANSKGVLIDITKCVGCGSCTVACKMWNGLKYEGENAHGQDVKLDYKNWTTVDHLKVQKDDKEVWRFVKRQCMHCKEPGCLSVCFSHSFHQTPEGAVHYDPELCVGCRYCMIACPFDIPKYEYDRVMPSVMKCQFCSSKLAAGESPACVSVCPTNAIMFGDREELLAQAKQTIQNDSKYVQHIYGENEAGGTNWMYISDVPFGDLGFPTNIGTMSIPDSTHRFVKFTPAIFIGGGALFTALSIYTKRRAHIAEDKDGKKNG